MCISNHKKKEWNFGVLTIVSSIDYEERIHSYMGRNGLSLRYRIYVFFSVDNFIKFSTHNQLIQSYKKGLIKKFDIKQLIILFTKGGKHKIITQSIS